MSSYQRDVQAAVQQAVRKDRRRNRGVLVGILACIFAVLGIFTLGMVFVPIAILCSLVGVLRGATALSLPGIAVSILGVVLSIVGMATSPSLLLIVGGMFVASQNHGPLKATKEVGEISSSVSSSPEQVDSAQRATSTPVPFTRRAPTTTAGDPHSSPEDHNAYYCLSLRLDYPYTRKCPEPWVTVDLAENNGEYNPLISCGSSGCFPMDESEAARKAAAEANAEDAREARALAAQPGANNSSLRSKDHF